MPTNMNKPGNPNKASVPRVYTLIGINMSTAFIIMLNPYSTTNANTILFTMLVIIFISIN